MTNTTQLLMDAARAAGYEIEWNERVGHLVFKNNGDAFVPHLWDRQAFRLMVDCGIEVGIGKGAATASIDGWSVMEFLSDHNNDKHAATRMAIVRAAAQSQEKGRP